MPPTIDQLPSILAKLYQVVHELEALFPGRHFTPDGHLVGSLGEAFAAYYYGVQLLPASTKGHDGKLGELLVQVKATQGHQIALRSEPRHLLVLRLHQDASFSEVYNGPGHLAWSLVASKKQPSNGQYAIGLSALRKLMQSVSPKERIPLAREPPGVSFGVRPEGQDKA